MANEKNLNQRIKFALYLKNWNYEAGDKKFLRKKAMRIIPTDYYPSMDGHIFCPVCNTNLNRVPKLKDYFSNGREAYFSHLGAYKNVTCNLRSTKPEGKKYDSYEEAQKAIDDENLVIVNGFIKEKPEISNGENPEYNETPVEDINGPISSVPISRHNGEHFKLPSRIKTINGICRKFDENLYKYYYFPNQTHVIRLVDLLHNVADVDETNDQPKLYYGEIESSSHRGKFKRPSNMRMTYLINNFQGEGVADFCIKMPHEKQERHGIGDDSIGRIVIMYGVVKSNGVGLCFSGLGWGEFALLPEKYESLLL